MSVVVARLSTTGHVLKMGGYFLKTCTLGYVVSCFGLCVISQRHTTLFELQFLKCRFAQLPGNDGPPKSEQIENLHAFTMKDWMLSMMSVHLNVAHEPTFKKKRIDAEIKT